jgi:hypothetical protein
MLQQDAELVAAESRQGVARAHPLPEDAAQLAKKLVPSEMATGVIHPLEAIQVKEAEHVLHPLIAGRRERPGETTLELRAIHEPGEGVVGGLMSQLPSDETVLGHVAGQKCHPGDDARRVVNRCGGDIESASPVTT